MTAMIDVIRSKSGRKPPIHRSFGCQSAEGLFHLEDVDLRRLWLPALTRDDLDRSPAPDGGAIGNPVEAVGADGPLDPATAAYLCGPPGRSRPRAAICRRWA